MKRFIKFSLNWNFVFFLIASLIFLSLSFYKASHSTFTHDESFTYLSYVKKSIIGIVSMEEPVSANNHILNTLGMKIVDKIISPSPFNLRLPNLFGHLLYIVFSYLFVLNFKKNILKIGGFVLLNANIYLIDLFSLARGYGISLGLLMVHFYFLNHLVKDSKNSLYFRISFLALFFAIMANFSIIYYAIALALVYLIFELINKVEPNKEFISPIKTNFKFLLLLGLLSLSFFYLPLSKLIKENQFYFGGENNFFDDTIFSLLFNSLGNVLLSENLLSIVYTLINSIVFLIFVYLAINLFRKRFWSSTNLYIGVFFIIMLMQVLFFYLFSTKYLIQRTAIFLIPIFIIALLNIIDDLDYFPLNFSTIIIAFFLLFFTVKYTPLDSSMNWRYDADNEKLLTDLNKIYHGSKTHRKLSLGIDWVFQPSLNFYRATTNVGVWLDTLIKEGYENKKYDYYFVESSNLSKFADTTQFKLVNTYTSSNNILIKNIKIEYP